jgi:CRP-like cAMP-binding protein
MVLLAPDDLKCYSLFGGLSDTQLGVLIARLSVQDVAAGAAIIREGEHGDRLWCIASGEVEVRRHGTVIARLGPGATIGEMELIDLQPRSATVTALTPCRLYGLALRDILSLQRVDLPAFTLVVMNLARDLSRRLRLLDEIVAHRHASPVERQAGGRPGPA